MNHVQLKCKTFAMAVNKDGLISYYFVPHWEEEEGYLYKTDFQWFEIEGKAAILEEIIEFVETKVGCENCSRGRLGFKRTD
jgi:hypothetical protein